MSKREIIMQVITGALTTIPAVDGRVWRGRLSPITDSECPAIAVAWTTETSQAISDAIDSCELTVQIDVHVVGEGYETRADAIVEDAHQVLMRDTVLKLLVTHLRRISGTARAEESAQNVAVTRTEYLIKYKSDKNHM
ncbi:hypothetical protein V8J88_03855 [Massilia sp. W12]|uniref:hypothetical protein n=1 Tax=Massilia sp. W12 TaxID=3126507 RepID=UPI0030D21814